MANESVITMSIDCAVANTWLDYSIILSIFIFENGINDDYNISKC
ncbi:hypothetical protein THERMOT_2288 [Bathymodiolus thermophilus thioautotrophic gill symbiont]|uniref:Uncharacterized protein n=1 Tax=Bathymodiolus thermophilus thioautotrophic gill symbiont TaxID=2360 RepID=A0A8H8XCQ9_9GAMM|nr:hypothetical protein THERMOS_468 [Bathymodiolus thermophilus thioautotrophic gill symbiont]CAB5506186.1 hypothetical protein THERMOT_2288 [Bathymodiolus thermophilus thioautotrophic gill symbiont]